MGQTLEINTLMPYSWPKTVGFFSSNQSELIKKHVEENEKWYVSEKLDGCNVSLSTNGWIASRNKIIANRESGPKMYQGLPLTEVQKMFDPLDNLYDHLITLLSPISNFELVLYGEFIPKGTATSKFDIYNYVERGYEQGLLYAFGIGLVFDVVNTDIEKKVKNLFKQAFLHGAPFDKFVYIVPIDWFLTKLFYKYDIDCVKITSVEKLQNLFTKPWYINLLLKRQIEGFILTNVNGKRLLKFKYPKSQSEFYTNHVNNLSTLGSPIFDKLLELYNNIPKYTCTFNIDLYIQLFEKHFNQSKIKKTYLDLAPFSFHFEPFVQSELNHLVYLIQKDMESILKLKLDPEVKCAIEQKSKSKLKYIIKHIIYNLD